MKFSKLSLKKTAFFPAICMLLLLTACNNDKSGNTSTTETDTTTLNTNTAATDTGTNVTTSAKPATGKKIGKVTIKPTEPDRTVAMKTDAKGYYNYTETAPFFPGGQSALETFITNNLEYPQEAIDNSIEGTVYVMFTIDENGKVGNVKTTGAQIGYGLEEEAVKALNGMTKWTPGMIKGEKVKAWYTLPITYRLES